MKVSMKLFVLGLLAALPSYAIVGGKDVAANDPLARSTVALLMTSAQGTAICTGSLVSANQILTAGHCAMGGDKIYAIFSTNVRLGSQQISLMREVVARRVAPSYYRSTVYSYSGDPSDVAILTIKGGAPAGFVPAKLITADIARSALSVGARITLAGYGATDFYATKGAGVLRSIKTKVDKFYISGRSVKVGSSDHGACHGDSGGPAIVSYEGQDYIFAVTSRSTQPDGTCTGRAIYSLIY